MHWAQSDTHHETDEREFDIVDTKWHIFEW